MNKLPTILACLSIAVAMSPAPSTAGGAGGYGGRPLGGVNLNYYCQTKFGKEFKSVLVGKTAGDWTCERNKTDRRAISVDGACKLQYGTPNVKARALNWNDPLSWRCFQTGKGK